MKRSHGAFSLVEVVIAVGVFAIAVVAVLALLPSLTREMAASEEQLVAQRLPDALQIELRRVAGTTGFDALASAMPVMAAPLESGYTLVAARDGVRLHSIESVPPPAADQIPPGDRFYLIELWRFSQPPLSYDANGAVLAAYARVSWPYYSPGSTAPTPPAARSQITFVVALNR